MLNSYETIFIVNPKIGEENVKSTVEKFKSLLSESATLDSIDEWGLRKLAYPIKNLDEGYYVLANFSAGHEFPRELERMYKITDGIIRYIVVKNSSTKEEAAHE